MAALTPLLICQSSHADHLELVSPGHAAAPARLGRAEHLSLPSLPLAPTSVCLPETPRAQRIFADRAC